MIERAGIAQIFHRTQLLRTFSTLCYATLHSNVPQFYAQFRSTRALTLTSPSKQSKAARCSSQAAAETYSFASPPTLSTFQFPYLTFGLWVTEPLFIVMSRCRDPVLQRQAAGLLSGQPRADYAEQILSRHSNGTSPGNCLARKDTDDWNVEQWIEFCTRTRLDAAMATYFAGLPSGYIDKPVYHPGST